MNQQRQMKGLFLISFFPALAYWYLESQYPISIAVAGGMALSIIEIGLEKLINKHVHTISKINFFLIAFLGGLSLIGEDGVWFKLQPFFTGMGIGSFLFYRIYRGRGLLREMVMGNEKMQHIPSEILEMIERHMALFFLITGFMMGGVALWTSTETWLFFKTIGNNILFVLFFIVEFFLIRQKSKELAENLVKQQVLSTLSPQFQPRDSRLP